MATIIDTDDFSAEIHIAGLSASTTRAKLTQFIDKYEPRYLQFALGYGFSKLFTAGREVDPLPDRWKWLLEGADYVDEYNYLQRWPGLKPAMDVCPIANYVYYWYSRDLASTTTIAGEKEGENEGSKNVSMALKQMRAWNEMVKVTYAMYDYLLCKKDENGALLYPEFDIKAITQPLETISFL